ncbi:MAG: hypothetical protein M1828_000465 [Chrysothrix sp. TS-e1954]|nr:MAG: hypothetical protein M1828_000465 [Chrysothrix sp. TS-e1954]
MSNASTSAALYAVVTSPSMVGPAPEIAKERQHHVKGGKGFRNPWPSSNTMSGPAIGWAMIKHRWGDKAHTPDTTPPTVTVRKPTFLPTRETNTLRATWLGHACYYVEFPGGLRVLFDPVWEDRCSPFSFMGPKRYTPVPCQIEDLPIIDAVVISHAHYDHLSHPTVLRIKKKHPNAHFFAALGNKKWFNESGITNATELDWWETRHLRLSKRASSSEKAPGHVVGGSEVSSDAEGDEITALIGCLPCQHSAARTGFDKDHTLWSSWSVESGGKKIWFGGDTGYRAVPMLPPEVDDYGEGHDYPHCPAFKDIGDHRGPFDLGLIPIGAYQPRFIMSTLHANPFDSVNIFVDTKCKTAMGIHWGTWVLTEEDVLEPPKLLKEALKRKGLPEEGVFDVCEIGESREFAGQAQSSKL